MAEKPSDPAATWRTMLGEWEKNVNAFANKAMEKEEFAKLMGVATGATTSAQGALADLMGRYLSTLNLPSRADIASIGERLQAIEGQLHQLTQLVGSMTGVAAPVPPGPPRPARTRQPPPAAASTPAPASPTEPSADQPPAPEALAAKAAPSPSLGEESVRRDGPVAPAIKRGAGDLL